jgi:hypothetical protein
MILALKKTQKLSGRMALTLLMAMGLQSFRAGKEEVCNISPLVREPRCCALNQLTPYLIAHSP